MVHLVAFLYVKRSLSVRWAGKVGFPHLGFIESLLLQMVLRETEKSYTEPHNNTVACLSEGCPCLSGPL